MNCRTVIRLGAFTALAATRGFIPPASAQSKMMFKASDVHPAGYPTVVAVENIGKKLETATNGRLGVQMFAAMQLGGERRPSSRPRSVPSNSPASALAHSGR